MSPYLHELGHDTRLERSTIPADPRLNSVAAPRSTPRRHPPAEKVWLNVYDLNPNNDALIWLGLGAFHSGVEVHGVEWTFGSSSGAAGSGVFSHAPKAAPGVPLRASLLLGEVQASAREVRAVVVAGAEGGVGEPTSKRR